MEIKRLDNRYKIVVIRQPEMLHYVMYLNDLINIIGIVHRTGFQFIGIQSASPQAAIH